MSKWVKWLKYIFMLIRKKSYYIYRLCQMLCHWNLTLPLKFFLLIRQILHRYIYANPANFNICIFMLIPLLKSYYICIFMLILQILTLAPLKCLKCYYKIYFRIASLKFENKSFFFTDNIMAFSWFLFKDGMRWKTFRICLEWEKKIV